MASIAKLIAGGVSAYTTCGFTTGDFANLASGSFVISDSVLANGTNLDLLAEVSFVVTMGGTTAAGCYMALWVMPENQDGTTYGDTIIDGAVLPASTYFAAACGVKVGVASASTIVGTFPRILLPRDDFKFGLSNHTGVALAATPALTCVYRTMNFNLNG